MTEPVGTPDLPDDLPGLVFRAAEIGDDWAEARGDLTAAFELARQAATDAVSIVFIVRNDDLLGRQGAARAMVAAGLVSAARTAALEGTTKGWTANVLVHDASVPPEAVLERARFVLANGHTTGEVIHLGPGHIGKALV
jgi:hypothetical protein